MAFKTGQRSKISSIDGDVLVHTWNQSDIIQTFVLGRQQVVNRFGHVRPQGLLSENANPVKAAEDMEQKSHGINEFYAAMQVYQNLWVGRGILPVVFIF